MRAAVVATLLLFFFSCGKMDDFTENEISYKKEEREIEIPAEESKKDNEIRRKLTNALYLGDLLTIKETIRDGVDVNTDIHEGRTLICYAVKKNNYDLTDYLIAQGAKVNVNCTYPPIYMAVEKKNLDIVKLLIYAGADVNKPCRISVSGASTTPLHAAVMNYDPGIFDEILCRTDDVNQTAHDTETALHYASRKCNYEAAEKLIERGADLNILNCMVQTPLDLAHDDKMKELLRSYGAMPAREFLTEKEFEEAGK